ncbi:MAG: ABC transporter ATP-binding protein [Clostridiales bacterium]|jgi:simple sugar transport system ATP-binding protein|nr:ABC transporter ATP-binding protein [Clostridiales bacterium]
MTDELNAIRLMDITKSFGDVLANHNISLDVRYGEILALLGENGSGKTTLMNILSGIYYPDSGHIIVGGEEVSIHSPKDAHDLGIGMIHQHFKLVDVLTATENIVLGLKGDARLNRKDLNETIGKLSAKYGFEIDPAKKIYNMSVSEKQTVEIIKLLYRGAEILILDEPTAVLTPQESEKLFKVLRNMRNDGKAIVIITHKLNEVLAVSDRVSILRKGCSVGTVITGDTNRQELTELMVGRAVSLEIERPDPPAIKDAFLKVIDLTCVDSDGHTVLDNISFTLNRGEILGVAGIAGSGQRELCEAITGLYPIKGGAILCRGETPSGSFHENIVGKTPTEIIKKGVAMAFVPEDRLGMGLVASMDMVDNMMLKSYKNGKGPFTDRSTPKKMAEHMIKALDIVTPGVFTPISLLSGGNVQKVLLGREIASSPSVLLVAYPVRGLDINSSYTIYDLLNEQKKKNVAILYIGEDLDVLLELCDRIMVLCGGKVSGIVDAKKTSKDKLGLMMVHADSEKDGETA